MNQPEDNPAKLARRKSTARLHLLNRTLMKRILSEVLRRKDGVERRNSRAGALRIEFIERSRNQSLGIEWFFAVDCAD
jgi:hypothetical protein